MHGSTPEPQTDVPPAKLRLSCGCKMELAVYDDGRPIVVGQGGSAFYFKARKGNGCKIDHERAQEQGKRLCAPLGDGMIEDPFVR